MKNDKEVVVNNERMFTVRKHVFYDLLDGVINLENARETN